MRKGGAPEVSSCWCFQNTLDCDDGLAEVLPGLLRCNVRPSVKPPAELPSFFSPQPNDGDVSFDQVTFDEDEEDEDGDGDDDDHGGGGGGGGGDDELAEAVSSDDLDVDLSPNIRRLSLDCDDHGRGSPSSSAADRQQDKDISVESGARASGAMAAPASPKRYSPVRRRALQRLDFDMAAEEPDECGIMQDLAASD